MPTSVTTASVHFLGEEAGNGGVFVLVKTSNPGSAELQGKPSGDGLVMEVMADLVREWGETRKGACGLNDIGAVVGATYPDEARALRKRMPDTIFLVPGYGAQGSGGAADALAGMRSDGQGVLVNSGRGITVPGKNKITVPGPMMIEVPPPAIPSTSPDEDLNRFRE